MRPSPQRGAAGIQSSLFLVLRRGRAGKENQQISIVASLCAARRARDSRPFSSLSAPPPAERTQQKCLALPGGCPGEVLIVPAARARAAAHTTQLNKSLASCPRAGSLNHCRYFAFPPRPRAGRAQRCSSWLPGKAGDAAQYQLPSPGAAAGRPRTHCLTSSASRPRAGERQSHHSLLCGLRARRRSFAIPTRTSKSWSSRRRTFTYVQNMNVHECKRSCTFKIWSKMLERHWCHGFFGSKNSKILVQWMCTIFYIQKVDVYECIRS